MEDPFVKIYHNQLSKDFCTHLIDKFEQSPLKHPGVVGVGENSGVFNPETKTSTDLLISHHTEFKVEDLFLKDSLDLVMNDYFANLPDKKVPWFSTLSDTGFQIQRTLPGERFIWHCDDNSPSLPLRKLAYIWYLNTVKEGGETEFLHGEKIKPQVGKCLVFPSTWTYQHRGVTPVSNTKYICTGFIVETGLG